MSFWGELKRRNVFKVGVAYAIVAWLLVQIANTFFPILHLPGWTVTLVAVLVILGFPLALIHAWAYEVTPDGIKRTKEVPLADSITHITGRKLNYLLAGLLIVAVGYIIVLQFIISKTPVQTEVAYTVSEQTLPATEVKESTKTIAVLPFDDLSPDKNQEYFVLGLSEEILNSLAQINDLTVIAKTSSFSFKGTNKTIQEIADVLGVENILEGSVRKAGNALRITAQLIKTVDGSHLWSKTYDKEFKAEEMFSVQEDIAVTVANELKITLGIDDSIQVLGGTDNQEAYELYLVALGVKQSIKAIQNYWDALNRVLALIDNAIELDPQFALAWSLKSIIHTEISFLGFSTNPDAERNAALRAARRAIELQPTLPNGYAALGNIKQSMGEFIEAAYAYNKAFELNFTKSELVGSGYAGFLHKVAYCKKAHEFLEEARRVDPLNVLVRIGYLVNLNYFGDIVQVEIENERCMEIFGKDWIGVGNIMFNAVLLGSGQAVTRDQFLNEVVIGGNTINNAVKEYLESPKEGLLVLRQFYSEADIPSQLDSFIALWAAYFGDTEFAMDVIEKSISISGGNIITYWVPLFSEVRQLPRFKELVRKIGLVDFWNEFDWPDLCRPLDNGDFECD